MKKRKLITWTDSELKTLHEFSKEGIDVLKAKLPQRSEQSIRTKCCYLGLYIGKVITVTERFYMVI